MFNNYKNRTPLLKIAFSIALMGAVLLQMGSVSATYIRCNTSGKQKVYLNEQKGCCPIFELEANSFDLRCCDYELYTTVFHNFKNEQRPIEFAQASALPVHSISLSANAIVSLEHKVLWKYQKAPPLYGIDYLHYLCKYTI